MKKLLLIAVLYFSGASIVSAQDNANNRPGQGRLQAYKIAFLTKRLDLSPAEAQKFWPLYNNYESDMRKVRMDNRQNNKSEIEAEERLLNIRKKYNQQFIKAMSVEKANTLFQSEKEFRNIVQKELKERKKRAD